MRLGTYSTIDCPTAHEDEAYSWLQAEFDKIGGNVRRVINPHDFGGYPSFEIDYPFTVEEANDFVDMHEDDDPDDASTSQEEFDKQQAIVDDWTDKANDVESRYSNKFTEWLQDFPHLMIEFVR